MEFQMIIFYESNVVLVINCETVIQAKKPCSVSSIVLSSSIVKKCLSFSLSNWRNSSYIEGTVAEKCLGFWDSQRDKWIALVNERSCKAYI